MAAELFITPSPALDSNANPYSGAKWYFYASGSSTPQNVYADAALANSLGSVVTADSAGRFPAIFLNTTQAYRGVLKDSSGTVTLEDLDPVGGAASQLGAYLASSAGAGAVGFVQAGAGAVTRTVQERLRDTVSVKDFGAVGDGVTDDTAAIQKAVDAINALGGGVVILPSGNTYVVDPNNPILVYSNIVISMHGATIKLKAGNYAFTTSAAFRNSSAVSYNAGVGRWSGIVFLGGTIDGNIANITFSANGGISGIVLYQADNCLIRDVTMVNMPGVNGNAYGIIARYCNNISVERPTITRTDRQNIFMLESTGYIRGGKLTHSYFRDCLAIGNDGAISYQPSDIIVDGVRFDNTLTSGTEVRTVRVTSGAFATLRNCKIVGKVATGAYTVYLTSTTEQMCTIENCEIIGGEYTVLVEGTSRKIINLRGNVHKSATNGFRFNAASGNGILRIDGDTFESSITARPLYVNSVDTVWLRDLSIRGGSTASFIGTYLNLNVDSVEITGMTDATRVLNISTATVGAALSHISNLTVRDNTANSINIDPTAFVTNVGCTLTGAGIKLGRIGQGYLWRDSTGDLRISFSLPATDTDGVVVGTQT